MKGESVRRSVVLVEVVEGIRCFMCSIKILRDFSGRRWWGVVKYEDLDENEKC